MTRSPGGWLRLAWAVPPWVAATAVTIARPRPDPGRAEGAAARWKRSKTRGSCPVGTPGPSALTCTVIVPSRSPAAMVAAVPGGVCGHVGEQIVGGAAQQFLITGHQESRVDGRVPGTVRVGDPGPLDAARPQRGKAKQPL